MYKISDCEFTHILQTIFSYGYTPFPKFHLNMPELYKPNDIDFNEFPQLKYS